MSNKINYDRLPELLQLFLGDVNDEISKEMQLYGALASISGTLPNISGSYRGENISPHLFYFVYGSAASGKGQLSRCRKLIEKVDEEISEEIEVVEELVDQDPFKDKRRRKPKLKPMKTLIFPGNMTWAAMLEMLNDNDGNGVIFETEADTIKAASAAEHGNFSADLRKAFHHEPISSARKKDKVLIKVVRPKITVVVSGTHNQLLKLMGNGYTEDGLFSRFMYKQMPDRPIWEMYDMDEGLLREAHERFEMAKRIVYENYIQLKNRNPLKFRLNPDQWRQFEEQMSSINDEFYGVFGDGVVPSVRRLGVIGFRIMMVLGALRFCEDGALSEKGDIELEDDFFQEAMKMIMNLSEQMKQAFSLFKENDAGKVVNRRDQFYDNLPEEFTRQDYLEVGKRLGIPDKTCQRYLVGLRSRNMVVKLGHDSYVCLSKFKGGANAKGKVVEEKV